MTKKFPIFLAAAFALLQSPIAFAADKVPQTMEEINADLKSKKAAMEPFDQKKVKVDVESLGLDDVDKKPVEQKLEEKTLEVVKPAEQKVETKAAEKKSEPAEQKTESKAAEKAPQPDTANPIVPSSTEEKKEAEVGAVSKIQNFLKNVGNDKVANDKTDKKTPVAAVPVTSATDIKKPTDQYINSAKKRNLKKRLEAEKHSKKIDKAQKDKSKKLNELREQYLIKSDENFSEDEVKIIPHRKEVNPFISEEMPAVPILNRFRTSDNLHIPIIPTPREKINLLFSAISIGSVSFFNDAYRGVENPNVKNDVGDTLLTCAILLRRYPIVASALGKGADPNLPNNLGYTPFSVGIEMLDFKSLELLTDNNVDINYTDAFGRTYLMHAARVGFLPAVELLVSKGVDINAMDNDGFTALSIAYRHKKEVIVAFLLKNGAQTWIEKPYNPEDKSIIRELENRWK